MSRKIGAGLVGLGVFLIVAAGLIRFYAYPSIATVPTNYDSVTELQAIGAEVFNTDPDVLESQVTDLSIESRTVADSRSDLPGGVAVWHNAVTITRADGSTFQQSQERSPFDASTGEAVDCAECGSWVEQAEGERTDVTREGQVYKFPFNTQQQDYEVWDSSIGAATTAEFQGVTEIDGLEVYEFVQKIDPVVIEIREVPGSLFGSDEPSVDAEMWYGVTRTNYILPATGGPIDRVEERVQELRYDGVSVPAFTGTVEYTDEQVATNVDEGKTSAMMLGGMRALFPALALILGLAALAGGLYLRRGAHGSKPEAKKSTPGLVNA